MRSMMKAKEPTLSSIAKTLEEHGELSVFIIEHMATKEDLAIEIGRSESRMLDAIDRTFGNLQGDVVAMTRKIDEKDSVLVRTLTRKRVVTKPEAKRILAMSPFPHPAQ